MSLWRQVSRGLRALFNRKAADQEIADEIAHFLDESAATFAARGLAREEALRAARLEPELRGDQHPDPGPGHRSQRGHLHHHRARAAPTSRLSSIGTAGHIDAHRAWNQAEGAWPFGIALLH